MSSVAVAVLIMAGLGIFFAGILAVAYRFLRVPENPMIEKVEGMLPGSNCGACGQPGCHAFAEKLVASEEAPSKCTVSSPDAVEAIAETLGVDPGQAEKRVARLHCAGGRGEARQIAEYAGFESCKAAALVSGGGKSCSWGCLGLADCETACTFGAIHMNSNGLPVVNIAACTACGDCVTGCPRDLFEILPVSHALLVQCKAPLAADEARALCSVVCDACGRCAQDAAPGLITMQTTPGHRLLEGGGPARPAATGSVPDGAIRWVTSEQFQEIEV
ncbi:MAG: (Fe-S)-binding protein [Candidatus Eisenbacteria bacterium]